MRILLTGGTGFIGRHLCPLLLELGHEVTVLSRSRDKARKLLGAQVDIIQHLDEVATTASIDCIINLAGEPIMGLPWSAARRQRILRSRLDTTQGLIDLIRRLHRKPQTLISGSAIGYYGIGAEAVTESAASTEIFQAQLCAAWEKVAMQASTFGVRVCCLRTGVVLGSDGGALPQLALPVKFGMGSVLGSGTQWVSWIHLEDMLRLIVFAIDNPQVQGPLNGTAPQPVTHGELMRTLAKTLHRPLLLRVPGFVLRTMLGEMSQLLLEGQQVLPASALANGFVFRYPDLEPALRNLFQAET